nr:MAG TPA: hypothetical protein [Caudoviricetes sp.]
MTILSGASIFPSPLQRIALLWMLSGFHSFTPSLNPP